MTDRKDRHNKMKLSRCCLSSVRVRDTSETNGSIQRVFRPIYSRDDSTITAVAVETSASLDFTFNKVFWTNATQLDVFQYLGAPLVAEAMKGNNCSLFAYGKFGCSHSFDQL